MKKAVITVALSVLLALLSANVNTVAHAQGNLVAPSNVAAQNTGNPGEVRISWDAVPNAEYYRIGWVAYSDVEPIIAAGGDWLEHFAFIDIENRGQTEHVITRLAPRVQYAFIMASNDGRYGTPRWPAATGWAYLTLNAAPATHASLGSTAVNLSWDAVPCAVYYRIGWVVYSDVEPIIASSGDWLEHFTFIDIANRGQTAHPITRLTPGLQYAFIVAGNDGRYGTPQWPPATGWQFQTPVPGAAPVAPLPGDPAQTCNPPLRPGAELVGLLTEPRGPVFTGLGQHIRLEVLGVYSDGASRVLADDAKIVFTSSAPEFVSIDASGMMTATGDGGADITATYGGFSTYAPAVVFLPSPEIPPIDPNMVYPLADDGFAIILNRLIVYTKNEYSGALARRIANRHDGDIIAEFPNLDSFLIEISASTITDLEAALEQLNQDPDVDEASPDSLFPASQGSASHTPETESRSTPGQTADMAAYKNVHLFEAWKVLNDLDSQPLHHVNVAVIDDGMFVDKCVTTDGSPKEEAVKSILQLEFPPNKTNQVLVHEKACESDFNDIDHGTAVVSVLAAADNKASADGQGLDQSFSGVLSSVVGLPYHVLVYHRSTNVVGEGLDKALERVEEFPKVSHSDFHHYLNNISDSKNNINASKVRVVNISAGCRSVVEAFFGRDFHLCKNPVSKFYEGGKNKDTLIVMSAGNIGGNDNKPIGDWSADGVLVVGGTNGGSTRADGLYDCGSAENGNMISGRHDKSKYGKAVNIAAPYCVYTINISQQGFDRIIIYGTAHQGQEIYNAWPGTSFSAPLVSGTAALLFAINPAFTAKDVENILVTTADKIANCTPDCAGWRSLNAHAAVCDAIYGNPNDDTATPCRNDRAALETLYNTTHGANWTGVKNYERWRSNLPLNQWHGVEADAYGRVTSLRLDANRLSGSIPPELGNLADLQVLDLGNNRLSGSIPKELGNLANLQMLRLYNNRLSGEIPPELGNLVNLHTLYLNWNKFTGEIPRGWGRITGWKVWHIIAGNSFTGCIPHGMQFVPRQPDQPPGDSQFGKLDFCQRPLNPTFRGEAGVVGPIRGKADLK